MFISSVTPINYNAYNPSQNSRISRQTDRVINIPQFKGYNQPQASYFSPWLSCELYKLQDLDFFNKIKMFKNLSLIEKKHCYEDIMSRATESGPFFATIMGYKPAYLVNGRNNQLEYLENINYGVPIDIVHAGISLNPEYYCAYLLNPYKSLEVVECNKNIFSRRLNLSDNSSTNEIYDKFKQILSKNDGSIRDLEGMILGFPKYSSMIFQLYNSNVKRNNFNLSNVNLFRTMLLNELYSADSPYKNLLPEEFNALETMIRTCNWYYSNNPYFQYSKFVNEPEAETRMFQNARDFNGEFSSDKLISLE